MTMAEMHLDLCIQSTNHLLETVSSIKENVRMLEVFLNSGLTTVVSKKIFQLKQFVIILKLEVRIIV